MGRPPSGFSARAQILRGAAEAFGGRGYAHTSVQHILDAAGVSRRTFYALFKNKDEVFDSLFGRALDRVLGHIRESVEGRSTAMDRLEAGVDAYLRYVDSIGPLARVLLIENFPPGSRFAQRREAAVESFIQTIAEAYRRLGREPVDPLLIRALVAGTHFVSVQVAIESPPGAYDAARARRLLLRILGAVLAGPEDPVPPLPVIRST
jgi:AcrR family transcriptional regulator